MQSIKNGTEARNKKIPRLTLQKDSQGPAHVFPEAQKICI